MSIKTKISASGWIGVIISLMVIFMVGLWQIDISASAMNTESNVTSLLTENLNPIFVYHSGFVLAIVSFFTMALVAIHHILPDNNKKKGGG